MVQNVKIFSGRMFAYFLISFATMAAINTQFVSPAAQSPGLRITSDSLSLAQIDSIAAKLSPVINIKAGENPPSTPNEIVQYLLSFFGGLLTTIIMYFLHKWFPQIFPSRKWRDYRK